MRHIREDIKERNPHLVKRAYQKKHREAAIRLFCLECMGNNITEVKKCTDHGCPLYQFRMSRDVLSHIGDTKL